ncbi:MAG TPA: hypothetical protein DFR83_06980 [Deltaproteobacteria bacterium]|nr:hypothetical protein [Deltaproteobacteria bacterium]
MPHPSTLHRVALAASALFAFIGALFITMHREEAVEPPPPAPTLSVEALRAGPKVHHARVGLHLPSSSVKSLDLRPVSSPPEDSAHWTLRPQTPSP